MQERSEAERRTIWPCLNVATWRRERSDRAIQQICKPFQINQVSTLAVTTLKASNLNCAVWDRIFIFCCMNRPRIYTHAIKIIYIYTHIKIIDVFVMCCEAPLRLCVPKENFSKKRVAQIRRSFPQLLKKLISPTGPKNNQRGNPQAAQLEDTGCRKWLIMLKK